MELKWCFHHIVSRVNIITVDVYPDHLAELTCAMFPHRKVTLFLFFSYCTLGKQLMCSSLFRGGEIGSSSLRVEY